MLVYLEELFTSFLKKLFTYLAPIFFYPFSH